MAAKRISIATVIALILAITAFSVVPAFAHHQDEHSKGKGSQESAANENSDKDGDADSDADTAYTEDTDGNDGTANNLPDEGDNWHPSGKDRSVEHGTSGNQGKAESNPDDSRGPMRFEGQLGDDKPNGTGGTDLADQDGNNGCGNDDDFNDDNNGWCGRPEQPTVTETPPNVPEDVEGGVITNPGRPEIPGETVLGGVITNPGRPEVAAERSVTQAAVLPFTGASVTPIAILGFGMMAAGAAVVLRSRKSN